MKLTRLILFLSLLLAATPLFAGIAYDAVADFNIGANPNGPWTYGYTTTSAAQYLGDGTFTALPNSNTFSNIDYWFDAGIDNFFPNVARSQIVQAIGPTNYFPDALSLHPALGSNLGVGDTAIVRWTNPADLYYNVSYEFFVADGSGGDGVFVDLGVNIGQVGGFNLGAVNISLPGASIGGSFNNVFIAAGTTVDFLVYRGADAAQDTTGLRASFSAVPEPGTYALVGCGLLGLAVLRRRRKA